MDKYFASPILAAAATPVRSVSQIVTLSAPAMTCAARLPQATGDAGYPSTLAGRAK
jgi:hypothetical protein